MSRTTRIAIGASAIVIFSCLVIFSTVQLLPSALNGFLSKGHTNEVYHAPKKNIWSDLDVTEFHQILDYLYNVPNNLNLTRAANSSTWDNHIAVIEVLHPNKTDALKYLDSDDAIPPRYAKVIVNQGSTEQAGLVQYSVGPLPPSQETKIEPLIWPFNSGRNFVKNPLPHYEEVVDWFGALGNEVTDVIDDLLGEIIQGPRFSTEIPPIMALSRPASFNENGTISSWATVHSTGPRFDSWSLLPQGLYCHFEITGRDSSQWEINEWFYNGVLYNSTASFRAAWERGEIKKLPPNIDGSWTAAEPKKHGLPGREKPAPVMIQPEGARWKVDKKERHVSWMGFEFYINTLQATAMSLWDIKFRGERVIYEIGLQEAMAHYAGNDPMTIGMLWMDTMFGMGLNMYELVPGFDCPSYATYMSTSFRQGEQTIYRNNSICVFEYTADYPIQRHTSTDHVTVSRNNYLIVRSVSTLGNYDYTFDYIFFLDGTIEVKVRASGYIFGAYHQLEAMRQDLIVQKRDVAQYDYGYQIHDVVASSMHDHTINFRADLDIAGTANTLYRIDVAPYSHQYPWEDFTRKSMRLEHHAIETETALTWPANAGSIYAVVNNGSTNRWNEKRGYRITPGTGMGNPPHLTIRDSPAVARAAGWATADVFVVRQHDHERSAGTEYNAMEPLDPLVDFARYLDGERTLQEDLVVYFNLGSHHVPQSGDVPNTLMHTAASSVMFVPHNWADEDPSRESAQGVKVSFAEGRETVVERFGGDYKKGHVVDKEDLSPRISGYGMPDSPMVAFLAWNETLAAL